MKAKFNAVEVTRTNNVVTLKSLVIGKPYPISEIRRIQTKFGLRLLVTLDDYCVFLPARYSDCFSDSEVVDFNLKILKKEETVALCVTEHTKGTVVVQFI